MKKNGSRILVVGQTPPPFGGQAMIIKKIIDSNYRQLEIYHVKMSFSKEMSKMGSFDFSKVIHLIKIIYDIYIYKYRYDINMLFYPPSGPNTIPIIRDIIILFFTRRLFKKIIFQFFAGGISEYYLATNKLLKYLMKKVYFYPDITIRPSLHSPNDGLIFQSKEDAILPWGVDDNFDKNKKIKQDRISILFVGVIRESKGILILLEACKILKEENVDFQLTVLGEYYSNEIQKNIFDYLEKNKLKNYIYFEGVKIDDSYYKCFYKADIFCFPTFFESENLPVVLIDAVKFGLPIITTNWRSIPEIVKDGVNGFLVEIQNIYQVVEKLKLLIYKKELRDDLGKNSREIYLNKFDNKIFIKKLEEIITR